MIDFLLDIVYRIIDELDSIQIASLLGVDWVGDDLSLWDCYTVLFFSGCLITLFYPDADPDDPIEYD